MEKLYRKSVAIVVFNKHKQLLVCERLDSTDSRSWQFPQGGVESGENVEVAAYRELFEETSITSVKLVKILDEPITYEFPNNIRINLWKNKNNKKYYGQEQHWILFYFYGEDLEINLHTKEPEFRSYAWKDAEFAINSIIDFKQETYIKALKELAPYIKDWK